MSSNSFLPLWFLARASSFLWRRYITTLSHTKLAVTVHCRELQTKRINRTVPNHDRYGNSRRMVPFAPSFSFPNRR